jgi:hypothetical protein
MKQKLIGLNILLLLWTNIIHCQIISTIAGGGVGALGNGGPATSASIGYFAGIVVDNWGNIYIGDGNNQMVRRVDAITGIITCVAGTGVLGYSIDGIPATSAQLNYPNYISIDKDNNLYISDEFRIRKVEVATGIISTIAGTGVSGDDGDGGPATAARISGGNMAWDTFGNLYLTAYRKIRKIDVDGIITTVAGTGIPGIIGDNVPATSTSIGIAQGIATDQNGNVYIDDSTGSIRKITVSTGIISRIAGTGDNVKTPYGGDDIPAKTCHIGPFGLRVDDTGNIYIADYANSRIERVDTFGIIRTIAGTGVAGFSGDGSIATLSKINRPQNVVLDQCNNVYIADFMNKRVRKITYHADCDATTKSKETKLVAEISIYPNPASKSIHISPASGMTINSIGIINYMGCLVYQQDNVGKQNISIGVDHLPKGVYVVRVNGVYMQRFVKE